MPAVNHTNANHAFFPQLTFAERKAALNLAQFGQPEAPVAHPVDGSGHDDTENLIKALIVSV